MACNVKFNNRGEVEQVLTDVGTPSQLYAEAKRKVGEKQALEIFYVSQSEEFKQTIPPQEKAEDQKGLSVQTKAELLDILKNKTFGMLTGENADAEQQTEEENRAANERAVKWLENKGYRPIPIEGKYGGNIENSFFVRGLTTEDAIEFAKEFKQESVATNNGLVYQDGSMNPINEGGEAVGGDYTDFYSTMNIKGTPVKFRVDYDFSNKVPSSIITPENSSNYANLTEDGEGNFVFYHKGAKGYETIRRSSGGTLATNRTEASALSKVGGLAMYYTAPEDSESIVSGATKYMVKIPMEKVYDFNSDPLNLIKEAKAQHAKEHPNKAFDANTQVAYITKLAGDRGYDMVVSEWDGRTRAQTIKEFTPVDTQEMYGNRIIKFFDKDYTSNREKGYISIIPRSKEDNLKDIYSDIYNERNAAYKYDDLYKLAETFPKLTQEEITQMIMNSDISQGLKDRYSSILNSPESRRESIKAIEPSLESVMQYITSQNENKEPLNDEQLQDYKNAILSTSGFSYERLKEVFYDENGVFLVSPSKLVASGLYSQYEAENLQKDVELQKTVKDSIEALKNTEEVEVEAQDFDVLEKLDEITSFGKLKNINPYEVEKEIQKALAGTTQEEFDEAIGELPFTNFQKTVNKEQLFNEMQAYKKAEMMIEVGGTIKPSLNANNEVVVPQVAQDLTGTKVLADIRNFMNQDLGILKLLKDDTQVLLNSIEKGLVKQGYDVIGLSSKAPDVYMMQYFDAVVDLSDNASQESLDHYVNIYNEYFEQDISPEKGFIKTKQDDRNFVKLNTELKEEEVYNQQGLIKQDEGLYIRVNKKSAEELYPIVMTYPEKLPEGIKTEEQLRKYVQSTLNNDEVSDTDTAEVINLFKLYFEIPLTQEVKKEDTTEFSQKQAQFTGDITYLTKDFVGDFYREGLKEKAAESKAYRDFYRHFGVTEKGLELVNNDPITLDTIQPYVSEDLKNYSLLSKSMPNLKFEEVEFVGSKNSRRDLVVNYPSTAAKFEGNISIIDDNNLISKNSNEEFIRLKNDIFENVGTIGNLTMYTKLDANRSNFLSFNVEAPLAQYQLEDYLHLNSSPESFIKAKNYLSKEEKNGLAEDEFSCL